jgi:hypothetical protein
MTNLFILIVAAFLALRVWLYICRRYPLTAYFIFGLVGGLTGGGHYHRNYYYRHRRWQRLSPGGRETYRGCGGSETQIQRRAPNDHRHHRPRQTGT